MDYLSNIELYYSAPENTSKKEVIISGDDYRHIVKVMRHNIGDELYVTNGQGKIFNGLIDRINKDSIDLSIRKIIEYNNPLANIIFCIPKLKSSDRFEFSLEKCTELGITQFIVFESERTIAKGNKLERWEKIVLSAMKQSLLSYLPKISVVNNIGDVLNQNCKKIVLEQNAKRDLKELELNNENYLFIFGPEGGLSKNELELFEEHEKYKIAENRLRSETAIIKSASIISSLNL